MSAVSRRWGASVTIGRELAHGSVVELRDRRLRVLHAPGHSPSDTLFLDEEGGMLFAGDHLLPTTSSNALVASRLPDTPKQPRYPALRTYRTSLAATRALDLDVVLPGHGEPIPDHRAVIDERLAQHEERADRILDLVRKQQSTAHELAHELWGRRAITQAYLTVSEVLGHLDLLIDRELVVEHEEEHPIRFAAD
jgi:glyoxylase-like metal-dependent hydrolase (beta-lactamase superfamily II)